MALVGTGVLLTLGTQNICYSLNKSQLKPEERIYVTYGRDTAPFIQSREHSAYVTLSELKELRKDEYVFNLKVD